MLTKGDIARQALKKIRISGLTSEPSPEDLIDAIQELDLMVGLWRSKGITASFTNTPDFAHPDPNQLSGVADNNVQSVILNLAINLCDFYGKEPSGTLRQQAQMAYSSLFSVVMPTIDGNPYLPMGRGASNVYAYTYNYNQFFTSEESAPVDARTMALQDTYDYTISWDDWLSEGASVESYTIAVSNGLLLVEDAQQGNEVYFKITAQATGAQTVQIQITSSEEGRVDNRTIHFNIVERKS